MITGQATGLSDTSLEARDVQLDLLRKAGFSRRLRMCVSLSRFAMDRSWQGFLRSHPHVEEKRRAQEFIRLLYGKQVHDDVFRVRPASDAV